ncbi:sensor histidine kinase [Streptomyces sp. NRRL B-1677]|uniref:histidine kinase n=1 Tax=Streptomyces klenkii TaxID=1420899 RepID=A0A3B0B5U8_9ACTN|nr:MULTISPECIES: histidine kinase [Streptomyces]MBF6047883.1 sensor histidine kinase [Streptomyces sp. NRRL B-1677]RKN69763.1 sensor histidine kinase [Streptomyces klenkii]
MDMTSEAMTEELPRTARSFRDWVVDILCIALAAVIGLLNAEALRKAPDVAPALLAADQIVGAAACVALWTRRRWPVPLAVTLIVVSTFLPPAGGAMLVAVFTVAVHRPFRTVAAVGGLALASEPLQPALRPDPDLPFLAATVTGMLLVLAVIGWGMFVRSRRQLVLSLRERAHRAEAEAQLRAEQAQRLARERIAREMHDVLAHRLSLLCVHAGALEFRPDAPPAEVARAAGVIRDSAHQALEELREVIGVLRAPGADGGGDRPQPTLAALGELVEESRQAGMSVTLHQQVSDAAPVPEATGRTVYRIVQEALTNARKHAAGAEVGVRVEGSPEAGLKIEIVNPPGGEQGGRGGRDGSPAGQGSVSVPGSGQGLIGLAERAALAGGRCAHGPTPDGGFRVHGWLPWRL